MNKLLLSVLLIYSTFQHDYVFSKSREIEANISQARLIDQIKRYLELKKRELDPKNEINDGLCNGFAFLAQYYASLNLEENFYQALQAISLWDGSQKGLQETKVGLCCYRNLEQLFEQWINDIVWTQQSYVRLDSSINFYLHHQRKRIEQFEFIKEPSDERKIAMLLSPILLNEISVEQLEELLALWSGFPNTILEFGAGQHATSARVLENGQFSYYDPNFTRRMEIVETPQKLARLIQKTKYRDLGKRYNPMAIELMAYQYVAPGEKPKRPALASKKQKKGKNSPNGFTTYHLAIFGNDLKQLRSLIQEKRGNPNAADVHGVTPLNLATHMGWTEGVNELLKHPKVDMYKSVGAGALSPIMAAIQSLNVEATLLLINHGANLFVTPEERHGLADIAASAEAGQGNYLRLASIPALIMSWMKNPHELEFIQELCRRFPEFMKLQDAEGNTLLHFAALSNNRTLMETLLREGAQLEHKNSAEQAAAMLLEVKATGTAAE
ncbi:MAG: hypothetical protein LLG04_14530 [Parachlamydia sp.]|nr:hypothetical protein [Parachlamydia sp.]